LRLVSRQREIARPEASPFGGVVLLLSSVLPALVFIGLTPILPQMEAHFHGQAGASFVVRLLVTVIGPTVIVGAPIAGFLAGRFGERRVMIWAAITFGLAGCVASLFDNLYAILTSRIVLGLAVAATSTLSTVILTKLYTGQARNRWLGYNGMVGGSAVLFLIPLCGFLGAISWRLVFLVHALAFPLVVLFVIGLPRDRPRATHAQIALERESPERTLIPWALIALSLACGSVSSSANLFMPFRLARMGITDSSKIGMLLLPGALAATLSALAFGTIRTRLSASAAFALMFSVVGAGLFVVALTTNLNIAIAGLAIFGFGVGLIVPNLFSVAAAMGTEADRSRLFGFTKSAYFAGPLLSQLVLEPVTRYGNAATAILTVGIFAASLSAWSLDRVRMEHRALSN
jgi:predicted MFS family arabinose efflux permease